MSTWSVIYERTATGWSAYVPALPGLGVAGASRAETDELLSEAIALHLEGMRAAGLPVPGPDDTDVGRVSASG